MVRFLFLSVFVFACLNLQAQSQFGLNGGLQLTSLHDEEDPNTGFKYARAAFRIGGFYENKLSKHWGFHVEMNYSLAGFKSETQYYNIHYLSLPLLAYYSPFKKLKIYLGPELNVLLRMDPTFKPFGEDFNRIDPGVTIGVEFLASQRIGISIRNYFGLRYNTKYDGGDYSPIDGDDPIILPDDFELKMNRSNILQLGINYYFKK